MRAVKIERTNKITQVTYTQTYIGKDEADCLEQAHQHPRKKDTPLSDKDWSFKIVESKERRGVSNLQAARDLHPGRVSFGDYEATGWMDE